MIFNSKIIYVLFSFFTIIDLVTSVIDYDVPLESELDYPSYYFRRCTRFNQKKMDPKDFFKSIHNPHYARIPSPKMSFNSYSHMINALETEYITYKKIITEETSHNLTADDAKRTVNAYLSYVNTRQDFRDTELRFEDITCRESKYLAFKNEPYSDKVDYVKLHQLNKTQFLAVKSMMSLLPKQEETNETFNQNHFEILKFMMYINPSVRGKLNLENPCLIRDKRVELFKSSYLLKDEKYYDYLIRMRNYGFIPFHYEFCQREFGAFINEPKLEVMFDSPTGYEIEKKGSELAIDIQRRSGSFKP